MTTTAALGMAPACAAGAGGGARASASDGLGTGSAAVILPLGESITYGVSWAGYDLPVPEQSTPGGYRGFLYHDLTQDGVSFSYTGSTEANPPLARDPADFRQEGHPGYRIDQLLGGLAHWKALDALQPSVILLHVGTNDISQGYDPAASYPGGYDGANPAERAEFVSHLVSRLEWLLGDLNGLYPGVRIVLCPIVPMGLTSPDPTVHAYGQAIRSTVVPWATGPGLRVDLADVEAAFLAQPTYHDLIGPDGVHPTPIGYRTMAAVIAPAVVQVLSRWPLVTGT